MENTKIDLTTSEVNTLIAALMLTSLRYEGHKEHPQESAKYKALENKLREQCYKGNAIATLCLITNFN